MNFDLTLTPSAPAFVFKADAPERFAAPYLYFSKERIVGGEHQSADALSSGYSWAGFLFGDARWVMNANSDIGTLRVRMVR